MYYWILFFILFNSFSFGQKNDRIIFEPYDIDQKIKPKLVSFEKLLANPNKYHNKIVKVYGFLALNPKSSIHYFYKNREAYLVKDSTNKILYSQFFEDSNVIIKKWNNNYAIVTARFVKNVSVNDKSYIGALYNILKVENTPKEVHCR